MSAASLLMQASGIAVQWDGRSLLQAVDVGIRSGEVHVLLGANGAGKSSLLRVLSGEWKPTQGVVQLKGQDLRQLGALAQARSRAVLPQHDQLQFGFSVREVVALGRLARSDVGAEAEQPLLEEVMQATGVAALAARSYPTLSGGERRLVQFTRVLAQVWDLPHPLLLLDEPVAGLDPAHQHGILALLRRLAARGAGVILSLHELNLAASYGDSISLIHQGRVLASGVTDEVLCQGNLKATYGSTLDFHAVPHGDRRQWLIAPQG